MILKDIGEGFYNRAPRSKQRLAMYIMDFFNQMLPYPNYCENHQSQFDALSDAFFETEDFSIWYASRGSGKTYLLSMLAYLESIFKPNCGTNILSGSLEQSMRAIAYLKYFWELPNAPVHMLVNNQVAGRGYKLNNGSYVMALAASSKSVRGGHPSKLRIDELDELDRKIYDAALGQPKTKFGIKDNVIVSSTLHKPFGLMSDILDEMDKTGAKLYKWCIKDVCDPYGFWKPDEIKRRRDQSTKAMFDAEYLCLRPQIGDSIWDFETIDKAYRRGMKIEFNPKISVEAGLDWGHTCSVMSIIQDDKEKINIPEAYAWEYRELNERCKDIAEICIERKIQVIYCDSNPKDSYITLKEIFKKKRIPTVVTPIAFNKWKDTGIDVVRFYLENDLINIKDKILQDKMKKYHYKNADQGVIDKIDDHYCDSLIAWASSRWRILALTREVK